MNIAIKQRIIGVIILLIVFLWIGIMLYKRHMNTPAPTEFSAPQMPQVPQQVLVEMATLQKDQLTSQQPSTTASLKPSTVRVPTAQTIKTSTMTLPPAWVIQLATFSNKQNAHNLLSNIRQGGYDAFSRDVILKGKKLTKVFVGPNISYTHTKQIQKSLEAHYHLRGVIQKYHIDSISSSD